MEELKLEGIVLRSTPFKETQRILSVLTKEHGLLSFLGNISAATGVLSRSSFLVRGKNKETLLRIQENTLLDDFPHLRTSLGSLQTAGKMGKLVLDMQKGSTTNPFVYLLFQKYLENIGKHPQEAMFVSFALKLARHEGLLHLENLCHCGKEALVLSEGESTCFEHKGSFGIVFSKQEWDNLCKLSSVRHFDDLKGSSVTKSELEKIELFFSQIL